MQHAFGPGAWASISPPGSVPPGAGRTSCAWPCSPPATAGCRCPVRWSTSCSQPTCPCQSCCGWCRWRRQVGAPRPPPPPHPAHTPACQRTHPCQGRLQLSRPACPDLPARSWLPAAAWLTAGAPAGKACYVAWTGGSAARSQEIGVPRALAECCGLTAGQTVHVEALPTPSVAQVTAAAGWSCLLQHGRPAHLQPSGLLGAGRCARATSPRHLPPSCPSLDAWTRCLAWRARGIRFPPFPRLPTCAAGCGCGAGGE